MNTDVLSALWHLLLLAFPVMAAAIIQMLRNQNVRINEIHKCADRRFDAMAEQHQAQHVQNIQRLARLEEGQTYGSDRMGVVERKLDQVLVVRRTR